MAIDGPSLNCLPVEVIEHVMNCSDISYVDVCRIAKVSRILNCVCKSNKLWRNKYEQMWPNLAHLFDCCSTDWKNEFRLRIEFNKRLTKRLQIISSYLYFHDKDDVFEAICNMSDFHHLGQDVVMDELQHIINDNIVCNLTLKYYAERALRYIQHKRLNSTWKSFLSQEDTCESFFIEGACLLSQWCQSNQPNCADEVPVILNSMAERVFEKIRESSPEHPLIKNGLLRAGERLYESLWTPSECRIVLCCINAVMFVEREFSYGDQSDVDNYFIDKVLISLVGSDILLCIVYEHIAARLGVKCFLIEFGGTFFLKWLEHSYLDEEQAYTFINVIQEGALVSQRQILDIVKTLEGGWISDQAFKAVEPIKVFAEICQKLVHVLYIHQEEEGSEEKFLLCNAHKLLCMMDPDHEHLESPSGFVRRNFATGNEIALLAEIASHDPVPTGIVGYLSAMVTVGAKICQQKPKKKCKHRKSEDVKYAVGMIMKHKIENYRCVIYEWSEYHLDEWFEYEKEDDGDDSPDKYEDTCYFVLTEHGMREFVAQVDIEIDDTYQPVSNSELGKYFESYEVDYYLPNKHKRQEYPDDVEALKRILSARHDK